MNKMGFGFLRPPMIGEEVDTDALNVLVDEYMARGGKFFDTAYTYLGGRSEAAIKTCVVSRKNREDFIRSDKLPGYNVKEKADCYKFFDEQLERCGVEYFDIFMLHWLNAKHAKIAEETGQFEFLQELKASGKAKNIGFSYHDSPELLDRILSKHPEIDYVLIQLNYLDWNSPSIQSKKCCETVVKHGKKCMVMEPVKGGTLANVPEDVEKLLKDFEPEESIASHAIRFAESQPGVSIVLSGMNSLEQIKDNMRDIEPITKEHEELLQKAAAMLRSSIAVPCTGCGYCMKNCPIGIPIPKFFSLYNDAMRTPKETWKIKPIYRGIAEETAKASACIKCRSCERHCPQKLPVSDYINKAADILE